MPTDPARDRVCVVLNTASRRGADAVEEVRRLLAAAGLGHARLDAVPVGSALDAALDAALETGPDLLVVGGGDGTLSAAAGKVAGTGTPLGVLPLGTANDFARTCQIPGVLEEAVRTLSTGKVVDVDLGRARAFGPGTAAVSRPFLNVASTGLSVGVTERLSARLKRRLGPLAYPVATLSAYRHHEPFSVRLEFPDGDHPTLELDDLLQVAVGNGRHYGGGNAVSPSASVDDHTLDLYAITRGRLRDHVSIARLLKDGSFVEHDRVHHLLTRRVRVHTSVPQPFNLDGEVALGTPVDFRVERNAVHVVVPRASTAASYDGQRAA
ncbi:diacylglycerol kinase [Marmoricola sp. Leaf446]|uniref:YegS/Rv2252/BmrU family lipid kinase n=1 Tax=Marmoricola sp. Leaf446 TaxID=1736379 RepID=UPI0007016772|nr:YegS/Rv2252/BmrU family lipid kinase [Marmoricola sp. Leaf446]KQT92204.1 diacylglycerol kinase [Marmoricola sp. Leaf446]